MAQYFSVCCFLINFQIQVGLLQKIGVLYRPVRGSNVFVSVNTSSRTEDILKASINKMTLCNSQFPQIDYTLSYPDGNAVVYTPGTTTPFSLFAYVNVWDTPSLIEQHQRNNCQ